MSSIRPPHKRTRCNDKGESSRPYRSRRMQSPVHVDINDAPNSIPFLNQPSHQYFDNGDCVNVCEYCGALFWYAERVLHNARLSTPKYRQCCRSGSVRLPRTLLPPLAIKQLFSDAHFMENIRAYNSMFSMTSFGAEVDETINDGRGPYVFKVSGQVSHWIGSLCPPSGEKPHFLQMYIYDTTNEISNRLRFFGSSSQQTLSPNIVSCLSQTLDAYNEYVKMFKSAHDLCNEVGVDDYSVRLYSQVNDGRYEAPAHGTLGGIVYDNDSNATSYDIILHAKDGSPKRVSKLHPFYMPLQYPILFPYGEQGWSPNMQLHTDQAARERRLTVNMYYSYQIHDRLDIYSLVLKSGKLFQQYLVDAYTCVEQNRLDYINANQDIFRSEYVSGVYDAIARGDAEGRDVGKRVFLPSSFTGGPRYMYKHYQDALALCRVFGNPQYFVTFTCNVNWPEITRHIEKMGHRHPQDRPDIIARIFELKVQDFLRFIRSDRTFGEVAADLYTIEFQKRGLPHCHTLIWVTHPYKIRQPTDVDQYICAEIPDPNVSPLLHKIVTDSMMHGPCGLLNPKSPCMREGHCSKKFPKPYESTTWFDKQGYVHYRRSVASHHVVKNGIILDNGYVVPYNKTLCTRFNAHINVEYCGWNMMIKYLFKYISKGADRIRFTITRSDQSSSSTSTSTECVVNEVKNFLDGRFICPHEAAWRILNFPIHERNPAVVILSDHLENVQNVTFRENHRLQAIINNPSFGKTTLTEWLNSNRDDSNGHDLTYMDYPCRYRWDASSKSWIRRIRLNNPSIGRLIHVHPTSGELFYLRMLLCHQRGCKSFTDIRTVGTTTYTTYREACEALGLLGDDREWLFAFTEAATWATSSELRALFTHMLLFCEVSQPLAFWESQWKQMSDDIRLRVQSTLTTTSTFINDVDLQQYVLVELERLLNSATPSKTLSDFGLPLPSATVLLSLANRLLMEETSYDRSSLATQHEQLHSQINPDQLRVYNAVTNALDNNSQILIFVYGHGGTGKTFLWTTIISLLRSAGKIVLAVAASGIASLLLPSGRTAHSRFKIPLDFTEQSSCYIKKNTQLSELLIRTSLIIWDEAPMNDRRCFECLDKTLRDILSDDTKPFGGKSVLLGGDFRQTLPIKRGWTN